ncbi:hypothetical protein [Nocardia suismassiliense]|uniref:hypothetical protein n=1 Tax=Nocardia suismassiliense TaxID=2077092 RepID=UPI00131F3179|nr:hypothetical protein [Nocardia suismassiliense]
MLRGEPATDPEIDRIAVAHAEKSLRRFQLRLGLIALPLGVVGGWFAGTLAVMFDLPLVVFLYVVLVVIIGAVFVVSRRKLALIRMLNVSRSTVRELVTPGSAEELEIRVTVAGVVRVMGPYLFLVAVLLLIGVMWTNPLLIGTGVVVCVPVLAYIVYLLTWALPKHPATVLDANGVHTPRMGLSVDWASFSEIRVVPVRASSRDTRQVISFMLHDDQVYLRQLPSWQAFIAKLNKKTYLSPLVITEPMVDKPVAEIAATAAALSGLPVSEVTQGVRQVG